jgi:transcriptional regulator with XRE-family HTH domain
MDLEGRMTATVPRRRGLGAGGDFAMRLRETMIARGIGFAELAGMLARAGAPTSPATLSYWASGRSRPRRRSSLGVVQALEQCLDLEDGELVDLVDIDAETWRYRSAAEAARLLPRGKEAEDARRAWGMRWDDGLRREYVRTALDLDTPQGEPILRYDVVLTAQRAGADRLLAVLEAPLDSLCSDGARVLGADLGRRTTLPGGATLVEVVLPRPLAEGEAAVLELAFPLPAAMRRGRFVSWHMRPADLAVTEVRLPSPGRQGAPSPEGGREWAVRRTVATVGRAGRRVDEVQAGSLPQGALLQSVMAEVVAATCVLEWE